METINHEGYLIKIIFERFLGLKIYNITIYFDDYDITIVEKFKVLFKERGISLAKKFINKITNF